MIGHRDADANPNADPDAPYKVNKSTDGRFTEPVRDTAKSITIIPKEVMKDAGVTSFRELVRVTPGVTLGTGEGGNAFGDRIFIRGFDARNDVYIDGMRDPGVSSREIFAVEQIEIVKGPSSAYMGRGTTGGAVGLQSKQGQFGNNFAVAELTGGTDNTFRGTLDVNREIAPGLAVRINGLYHTGDTPGRDYVDSQRWGGAIAIDWKLSDQFKIQTDYYHYRSNGMSDYGQPFNPATQEPYAVNASNFYGVVGRDFLKNGSDVGTVALEWSPSSWFTLRNQTRYGEVYNRYVVSVPRSPRVVTNPPSAADAANGFTAGELVVDTGTAQRNATTDYVGNLTTGTARFETGGIKHVVVFGGEYSNEKVTNLRYAFPAFVEDGSGTQIGTPSGFTRDLYNPNPVLGYTIPAIVDTTTPPGVTQVETYSLFLLDTIKFNPHFELMLGGRYDTFNITSTSGTTTIKSDVNFFNWQASLLYKPVEAVTLYASYATSSNPSGEQLDSTSPAYGGLNGAQGLEPERNKAFEVGAKWEVSDGHLLLTAAAFRINKDNARENIGGGVYELVGKMRSQGFELGVNGNITPRWSVFGGYTYLDAIITDSSTAAYIGQPFANVPKHSASLLTTYAITNRFTLGAQGTYRSRIYGGTPAAGTASVPGYWKFDAVARYRLTDGIELRANVLNIFDKRYYDAIYRSGTPFSYVAPGRSATMSVTATF